MPAQRGANVQSTAHRTPPGFEKDSACVTGPSEFRLRNAFWSACSDDHGLLRRYSQLPRVPALRPMLRSFALGRENLKTFNLARLTHSSLIAVVLVSLLSACSTVRLISDYDEPTDKALTALQKSTDDFITKLIAAAPSDGNAFDKHTTFYEDADQQLRQLEFRVTSIPKNEHTTALVAKVRAALLGEGKCTAEGASLRDLHCIPESRLKGPSKVSLQIAQRSVNQTIGGALALELAKKQGLEQNK